MTRHALVSPRLRPLMPALAGALLLLAGCQVVPGGTGTSGSVTIEGEDASVQVVFGDRDRRRIRDYYEGRRDGGLPPGLAKKGELPPGLQKQVERGGTLPPGLRMQALPDELERRLEPVPDGYVRARVGLDVVLVDEDTRVIVDVIHEVVDD